MDGQELARQLGISETAVRRAEKAGRIRREADGAWDLARVEAAWASNTDQAQQRWEPGARERSGRPARMKPVPEAAIGAVRETLREHGEPIAAAPGQAMTFMQARTANEVLKAQERRLRLQQMKGELVDRAKAVAQVFKLAREERDAWVNWPARVTAMMAAELSSCSDAAGRTVQVDPHTLHTVLERHVRSTSRSLPRSDRACADHHQEDFLMLEWLSRHRLVRGGTAFLAALLVYVSAVSLAYMLIGQVAKLAASGA